jgi:hypothetical protein
VKNLSNVPPPYVEKLGWTKTCNGGGGESAWMFTSMTHMFRPPSSLGITHVRLSEGSLATDGHISLGNRLYSVDSNDVT